jgi:hypothetical protein
MARQRYNRHGFKDLIANLNQKMDDTDRIIEGTFASSLFRRRPGPIVRYAPAGEMIPVACRKCGAVFLTKNIAYIGYSKIYFGDDYDKCQKCSDKGHVARYLRPDRNRYRKGLGS